MQISRTKGPGAIIPTSTNEMVVTKIVGTEEQSNVAPLPPQPQEIIFQTPDGETLAGYYYPGLKNPSPLIVLMHWALGEQGRLGRNCILATKSRVRGKHIA